MNRFMAAVIIAGLIFCAFPRSANAQDSGFKVLFKDVIYGGLAGAVVGGAVLAFVDQPGEHLDYIAKGAAVGVIAGAAFGLYDASTSVAELEGNTLTVGLPALQLMVESDPVGFRRTRLDARLFTWRY